MEKKLTIGLFNDSFFPMADGVIMVVDNYARRLSKYANVIVFVPSYLGNTYDDSSLPYKVVRCHSVKTFIIDYSLPIPKIDRKFIKELNKYELDIVHIHSPFSLGKIGLKYAKKHKIPCIATMHTQFKQDIVKFFKSDYLVNKINDKIINVFDSCDECWAVNREVARIYYEDYKCKTLPRVMNNATEMLPVENKLKAKAYINKKHHIKPYEKVFLFVGRINVLKNILFIADSINALLQKNPKFKFKMLFVGSGKDMNLLINRINKLGIEKYCIICGKITDRDELAKYYCRADLFLFPSVYDASSIVQIEAASQSTPTLFLKDTATSSTVTDNINGFLSDDTVGAYSDKIIEIMQNRKLLENVSKNSFIDIYRTWDDAIDEVYEMYLKHLKKEQKKNM